MMIISILNSVLILIRKLNNLQIIEAMHIWRQATGEGFEVSYSDTYNITIIINTLQGAKNCILSKSLYHGKF